MLRNSFARGGATPGEDGGRRQQRRWSVWRFVAPLAAVWTLATSTAAWPADPGKASSSRRAKEEAIQAIPFDKLDAQARAQVRHVLENVSVFRRLPTQVIRAEPSLYHYFLDHPDVTVEMWRTLGLTELNVQRTGQNRFHLDDGQGTSGDAQIIYRSHDTHVIYTQGRYEGSLFPKPVQGHVVILLRTGYVREPSGEFHITSRLDAFVRMENVGVDLIAKTFHPLAGKIIDENFIEAIKFVGSVSRTAEVNPESMQAITERMQGVDAKDQDQLIRVIADIGEKSRIRRAQTAGPIASRTRVSPAERK